MMNKLSKQFNTIIVGGGSAGCVLANRLSANPDHHVLVLEAGCPDWSWDIFIHMPAALTIPIGNKNYDWCYESEPEPFMHNRRIFQGRGKILGGSSSITGGDAFRGTEGPLVLERGPATNPLFNAFFEAVQQAGYPRTDDVNGYKQEGFAAFDRNVHRGRRLSAARAYLHPVMMLAKKAADLIMDNTPLSSVEVDYYRHQ